MNELQLTYFPQHESLRLVCFLSDPLQVVVNIIWQAFPWSLPLTRSPHSSCDAIGLLLWLHVVSLPEILALDSLRRYDIPIPPRTQVLSFCSLFSSWNILIPRKTDFPRILFTLVHHEIVISPKDTILLRFYSCFSWVTICPGLCMSCSTLTINDRMTAQLRVRPSTRHFLASVRRNAVRLCREKWQVAPGEVAGVTRYSFLFHFAVRRDSC